MIWNQVELFNVSQIRQQEDGAFQFFRFPDTVLEQFKSNETSNTSGRTTTGCEIRFVGNAADITLSADMGVDTYEIGSSQQFKMMKGVSESLAGRIGLSSYVLRNGFGERGNYALSPKVKNGWLIGILSPLRLIYKMSLKTQLLCGFRLFLLGKPSWDLVIHSILQVVDALCASLQIRCTAHNLRGWTAKHRKSLSKSSV